jgi:hypothetical protein
MDKKGMHLKAVFDAIGIAAELAPDEDVLVGRGGLPFVAIKKKHEK